MMQKQKTITVFTPTFNRAYCLHQLYESLCGQTSDDFVWLIIDDGSSDNTKELVEKWIAEDMIEIQYHYKENGGMHTGHNLALSLINTELNVCIDSDDYMTHNAVNNILKHWKEYGSYKYAGILALDSYVDGKIVSNKKFPENVISGNYSRLKKDYGIVGDVKFIYKTDIIKKYPDYPVFQNEKFVPLGYKYRIIDRDYKMLFMNEIVCVVEYMPDGSTLNMYKQYYKNPKGFAYSRLFTIPNMYDFKDSFFQSIHFVAETFLSRGKLFANNNKLKIFFALPFGMALYFYIIYNNKK
jgi:glycosyltransferase involved in cell wall biosynthesis